MNALSLLVAAVMAAESGPTGPAERPAAPLAPEQRAASLQAEPAASDLDALLATADAAWTVRDEPGKQAELAAVLDDASRMAPGSYAVLWRQARHFGWLAEEPKLADAEKSRIGKLAWEAGDKASALEPGSVEGYFYAMSGVGNYSLGIGVISALAKGIEGKFKARLARAEAIDPGFEAGAIPMSWGRLYYELPWPKHDARLSEKYLRESIARNAENVRAHVYLGDLLLDEGHAEEARAAYQRAVAVAVVPGHGDPPEQRRWQVVARQALEKLSRK
jgi:tetratricopeptide (TPR) repeat protein